MVHKGERWGLSFHTNDHPSVATALAAHLLHHLLFLLPLYRLKLGAGYFLPLLWRDQSQCTSLFNFGSLHTERSALLHPAAFEDQSRQSTPVLRTCRNRNSCGKPCLDRVP